MDETQLASLPNQIIAGATGALGFFDLVYEKVEAVKSRRLSIRNYLRAYYFEVINNLELLDVLNMKRLKAADVSSPAFGKLVGRLETQIGAAILFADDIDKTGDLFKFLKTKGRIENRRKSIVVYRKGVESSYAGKILYENVLQAVSFVVIKIELLKRLSTFEIGEREFLNTILLERRIVNIRERLIMIKSAMDQMDGIREISR